MPRCYLGKGEWSYFYNYIIFSIFFNTLKDVMIKQAIILKEKDLLQSIYQYLGFIIFGFIFFIIFKKNIGFSRIKKNEQNDNQKLIFNDNL